MGSHSLQQFLKSHIHFLLFLIPRYVGKRWGDGTFTSIRCHSSGNSKCNLKVCAQQLAKSHPPNGSKRLASKGDYKTLVAILWNYSFLPLNTMDSCLPLWQGPSVRFLRRMRMFLAYTRYNWLALHKNRVRKSLCFHPDSHCNTGVCCSFFSVPTVCFQATFYLNESKVSHSQDQKSLQFISIKLAFY